MADGWIAEPGGRPLRGGVVDRWLYRGAPIALLLPAALLHDVGDYGRAVGGLLGSSGLAEWQPLWTYLH